MILMSCTQHLSATNLIIRMMSVKVPRLSAAILHITSDLLYVITDPLISLHHTAKAGSSWHHSQSQQTIRQSFSDAPDNGVPPLTHSAPSCLYFLFNTPFCSCFMGVGEIMLTTHIPRISAMMMGGYNVFVQLLTGTGQPIS